MMSTSYCAAAVIIAALAVTCLASPLFQDDQKTEAQLLGNPCGGKDVLGCLVELAVARQNIERLSAHKRNSEIINSILGLPRVLNDAGRR